MASTEETVRLHMEPSVSVGCRRCRLLRPVRDHDGRGRFNEEARILREISNLGRRMFLVEFDDGATTFLFPDELTIQ
jgi:hypothetical protein